MHTKIIRRIREEGGIALLYVILVIGFLVTVSASVLSIAYQQTVLSSYNASSLTSYYASESGLECGLYWDTVYNAFKPDPAHPDAANYATTTRCNAQESRVYPNTGISEVVFVYPDGSVAEVTVDKRDWSEPTIKSLGYNTTDKTNGRRLERGVNLTYSQNIQTETTEENDIMLAMDNSGSVTSYITTLRAAGRAIVDNLNVDDSKTKIGIVTFNSSAALLLGLSGSRPVVENAVDNIPTTPYTTNLAGALIKSDIELTAHQRASAVPFVVVITDGNTNACANSVGTSYSCTTLGTTPAAQAIEKAEALKAKGVTIAAVGVGYLGNISTPTGTKKGDVFLKEDIASDPSLYLSVSDWDQLVQQVQDTFTQDFFKSTRAGFERQEL